MTKSELHAEAVKIVEQLVSCIEKMAAAQVKEETHAMTEAIVSAIPQLVAVPVVPAELPMERLLTVKEIAKVLGCKEAAVKQRMNNGTLAYIVEKGTKDRKIPYSWLLEYMYGHTRYTGTYKDRRPVPDGEGIGAACQLHLVTQDEKIA